MIKCDNISNSKHQIPNSNLDTGLRCFFIGIWILGFVILNLFLKIFLNYKFKLILVRKETNKRVSLQGFMV